MEFCSSHCGGRVILEMASGQDGSYTNLDEVWSGVDNIDGQDDLLPQPIYLSMRDVKIQMANHGASSPEYLQEGDDSSGEEEGDDNYELIAPPLES